MTKGLRYKDAAKYYDLLFEWKDYGKDTKRLVSVIKKYKKSNGRELLELACGTGNYLKYLQRDFSCTGLDLYSEMLIVAKKKVPRAKYVKANMINFKLKKHFDVIVCLFADIAYAKTYPNLTKMLKNIHAHLKKGGVLVFDPWLDTPKYVPGIPQMVTHNGKDLKIAWMSVSNIKNGMADETMHYLIAEKNKPVKHLVVRDVGGLFEKRKVLGIMKKAGFDAKYVKKGLSKDLGLYVGVRSGNKKRW